jgi:hypothetical protein
VVSVQEIGTVGGGKKGRERKEERKKSWEREESGNKIGVSN